MYIYAGSFIYTFTYMSAYTHMRIYISRHMYIYIFLFSLRGPQKLFRCEFQMYENMLP